MSLVYSATLGSPIRKAVALKLADHADDNGASIYPSIAAIAAAIEVDRRTVERTLSQFRADGFLKVTRKGGGRNNTTRYRMHLPWLHARMRRNPDTETPIDCRGFCENPGTETPFLCRKTPAQRRGNHQEPSEDWVPGKRKRVVVEGDWP